MGRAYEVRKASIQKTGAAKAKLYSMYAKEIYQAAKNGGCDPASNAALKRLMDRAKKEQVPGDIIKRAVDKVNNGAGEDYVNTTYELFGPGGSTIIVDCLTDNVNRSVSEIRAVVNKCHIKLGAQGSVLYTYDHLCVVSFKGLKEEETLDLLLENDIDITDIETEDDEIIIYAEPQEMFNIKEVVSKKIPNVSFSMDEIVYISKEKIDLNIEDKQIFEKIITMLDEIEDVQNTYHNVKM